MGVSIKATTLKQRSLRFKQYGVVLAQKMISVLASWIKVLQYYINPNKVRKKYYHFFSAGDHDCLYRIVRACNYSTLQRTKEISIRKVLGAGTNYHHIYFVKRFSQARDYRSIYCFSYFMVGNGLLAQELCVQNKY